MEGEETNQVRQLEPQLNGESYNQAAILPLQPQVVDVHLQPDSHV